ncbi:MAG: hypothetical protein CVU07_10975 [Bacteroidetes bacterium HGW-Bacteroidetes-23]|nr:MAG: hypothetical protein CVU07_10975 [Bacteroidetes bacterium HGW-Bacteroidetes-23]
MPTDLTDDLLKGIDVDLSSAFDRNFENKSFFDKSWPKEKLFNRKGSLLARTNSLRKSIRSVRGPGQVSWLSSLPYASIHNEGGEVVVTAKMKKFFWAMFYKSSGAVSETKKGKVRNNERNRRLNVEATQWKALALQPVGKVMKVEERRFIGPHPQVDSIVKQNADILAQKIDKDIKQ